MTTIADLFSQHELVDYSANRTYPVMLGDTLFPTRRVEALTLDVLSRSTKVPILANVAGFDTEAEIGSREANKQVQDLALIKRKMQIKEQDLYALLNPRTPQEGDYLRNNVYGDFDVLNQGVLAQIERMAMELLATGKVTLNPDDKKSGVLDYQVPKTHQVAATTAWDSDDADPLNDLFDWSDMLDITPTRAITSKKLYRAFTRNAKVIAAVFGKDSGRVVGQADLDTFLEAQGLPIIRPYGDKYKTQGANGKFTTKTYWPDDKIALFDDEIVGEKIFGPTPEELANLSDVQGSTVANIYDMVYTESKDPVGTFEKASAVALPSLAEPDQILQATVTLSK
ncbi:major capsid protein [Lacticaseibacillus yichunensis]|uniref:Major capsid protein n=1 Tax=Lacticaseibacillus yichunensis TaxID=2486015 RepID=A0ABW4CJZ4_9LACO|nr:major capsid protein [Lacticaseibacillus yichunensis]